MAAAGVTAGLLGGLVARLIPDSVIGDVQLGNVAEWVAGLGTIGALVYAGRALRNDVDVRRAEEADEAERAGTAVTVQVLGAGTGTSAGISTTRGTVRITNGHHRPIRRLDLYVTAGELVLLHREIPELRGNREIAFRYDGSWSATDFPNGPGDRVAAVLWYESGGRMWESADPGLGPAPVPDAKLRSAGWVREVKSQSDPP